MSEFATYETGLDKLLRELGTAHPRYTEALTLQSRLLENLARARLYGDTETRRAERAEIVGGLNSLALETIGKSFNALVSPGNAVVHPRASDTDAMDQSARRGREWAARGDFRRAVAEYEHAVAVARDRGAAQSEALYLRELGAMLLRQAKTRPDQRQAILGRAGETLQRALALLDDQDADIVLRARTRYHLGQCYHRMGRWREAISLLEQARRTFSEHKTRQELAHTLLELGQLYYQLRDFDSARIYLGDALRLFRRLNDADGIAVTQESLGNLSLQTARVPEAIVSLQEARRGYETLKRENRIREVDNLLHIAHQAIAPAVK